MNNHPTIRVLLIEDNPADILLVRAMLADITDASFVLTPVERLVSGLAHVRVEPFDVVLLDLGLPDSNGLSTFTQLHQSAPSLPVVVLTGLNDALMGLKAMQAGAQDYLVKSQLQAPLLGRAIRYAIERQRLATASQQAEAIISLSATRLALAQQIAHLGNWELDLLSGELHWSDEVFRIFGANPQEFPVTAETFFSFVHPGDVEEVRTAVSEALAAHQSYSLDHRIIRCDGKVGYVQECAEPFYDKAGRALRLVGTVLDITARKEAEETLRQQERWFRALIERSADSIAVIDQHNHILYVSPSVKAVEGYEPEELIGRNGLENTHPDDLPIVEEAVRQLLAKPGQPIPVLWRRRHKNGQWLWLEGVATNLLDDPAVRGIVTNYRDVSERRQTEELLRDSHAQLRQLAAHLQTVREDERASLAYEIHDELGQLLTALKMRLKGMERQLPTDKQTLSGELAESLELVSQTLQIARRIAMSSRPPILDDFGLGAALEWQVQEFQKYSGIRCRLESLPMNVELDPNCTIGLFRICQESLTNVSRHAQASEVTIGFTQQQNQLVMQIRDNGKGVTSAELAQRRSLGILGMRERALAFGGAFSIQGQPQQGTIITITIPLPNNAVSAN